MLGFGLTSKVSVLTPRIEGLLLHGGSEKMDCNFRWLLEHTTMTLAKVLGDHCGVPVYAKYR